MRTLAFIAAACLWLCVEPAWAQELRYGKLELCDPACREAGVEDADPRGRLIRLRQSIVVESLPEAGELPLMVRIAAMASSEVRWNGQLIGRNGMPAERAGEEIPGRFTTTNLVPTALLRTGENQLEISMSGHRLWLPVGRPVHFIEVARYQSAELELQSYYRTAIIASGLLAAAFLYFVGATVLGVSRRSSAIAALLALAALLQLGIEVSRAFVDYAYPWHLFRVSAIALLSAASAVLLAFYAAIRFRQPVAAFAGWVGLAAALSLALFPAFDIKAGAALIAGILALLVAAALGRSYAPVAARLAIGLALLAATMIVADTTMFLDRDWYLLVALGMAILVLERIVASRRDRKERDESKAEARMLADRLAKAERQGEAILQLKHGSGYRRIAQDDVIAIRAADDYSEALHVDGRTVLITMSLAKLLDRLPPAFVRVHKSWAVNRSHLLAVKIPPGGGRRLAMSDGSIIPVGRRFQKALETMGNGAGAATAEGG